MIETNIPESKVQNLEPEQPEAEYTYQQLADLMDKSWKAIENSRNFMEYQLHWKDYDTYMDLKNKLLTKTKK